MDSRARGLHGSAASRPGQPVRAVQPRKTLRRTAPVGPTPTRPAVNWRGAHRPPLSPAPRRFSLSQNELGPRRLKRMDYAERRDASQRQIELDERTSLPISIWGRALLSRGRRRAVAKWERLIDRSPERAYLCSRASKGVSENQRSERFPALCRRLIEANRRTGAPGWRSPPLVISRTPHQRARRSCSSARAQTDALGSISHLAHAPTSTCHQRSSRARELTREAVFYLDRTSASLPLPQHRALCVALSATSGIRLSRRGLRRQKKVEV